MTKNELRAYGAREHAKGVADAIKVIKGMGLDWPSSVDPVVWLSYRGVRNVAEEYQREFIMRILQRYPEGAVA